jgi:hypothetical protein
MDNTALQLFLVYVPLVQALYKLGYAELEN